MALEPGKRKELLRQRGDRKVLRDPGRSGRRQGTVFGPAANAGDLRTKRTAGGGTGDPNHFVYVAAADSPAWATAVADYTCDGTADESTIDEALAAGGGPRDVLLLPGTYELDNPITGGAYNGWSLRAAGGPVGVPARTTLSLKNNTAGIQSAGSYVTVEGLYFTAGTVGARAAWGVRLSGWGVKCVNNEFLLPHAILIEDGECEVSGNVVWPNWTPNGTNGAIEVSNVCEDTLVASNEVFGTRHADEYGIIAHGQRTQVVSNLLSECGNGIRVGSYDTVSVQANAVLECEHRGIWADNTSSDVAVVGNTVRMRGGCTAGIQIDGHHCSVLGNRVDVNANQLTGQETEHGVVVTSNDNAVVGNDVRKISQGGSDWHTAVQLDGNTNVVRGNVVSYADTAYEDNGTGNVIEDAVEVGTPAHTHTSSDITDLADPVRVDVEANRGQASAYTGYGFFASDTEALFFSDGNNWWQVDNITKIVDDALSGAFGGVAFGQGVFG